MMVIVVGLAVVAWIVHFRISSMAQQWQGMPTPQMEEEKKFRYKLMFSFGEDLERGLSAAHQACNNRPSCVDGLIPILELKIVFAELGYWLGPELDGARMVMNASMKNMFSFRDVVSWWSQSQRSWLFLLDETSFKQRQT